MTEEADLLSIENLTVDLPPWADRRHAVEDVSLALRRNEILCVVGESGSGKSVMARAILGLSTSRHVQPSAGRILYAGEDLLQAAPERMRALRGSRIAMIFQEPMTALNPVLTIGRQIEEAIAVHVQERSRDERRQQVLDMLAAVQLPDPARIHASYPHQISGGQRQRAMIAMALILEPDILIADEPTTALDVTTQAQVLALIREMQRKRRMAVLFITHDFGVVAEIADRIAVMQHGRLVEHGAAQEILERPQHVYTRALLAAVPDLAPAPARQNFIGAATALKVSGLQKSYRGKGLFRAAAKVVHAARDVAIEIRRGETVGIVGESGSGKSTVARCIARLVESDAGEIRVGDVDFGRLRSRALRENRKRIQTVFQDPYGSLDPRQSVGSLIAEGPMIHGASAQDARRRALELLALVGLDARSADRFPHEFSGGQRQRIGLARALALEPDVLIADEPVSALDVSVQAQVLRLLAEIRERLGLSVLFITHDLRVAGQVCDSIAVMRHGEIVEFGRTETLFNAPSHPYTRTLFAAVPGRAWSQRRATAAKEPS